MGWGKKKERVVEEEDEAMARVRLLAEAAANIDIINQFANAFIDINMRIWRAIYHDQNVPNDIKLEMWKHSVSEFWETVRSGGIFTLSETVKRVGEIIRAALIKALEERE